MGYNRADYVRIKNEYNNKYARARQAADRCRDEVHQNIPEVAELDRMLSRVGSEIMGVIVAGGEQVEERVSALKERNLALQARRAELLMANGYPADYTDVKYECDKCNDSGFVDERICDCMKRALVLAGYESSGIGGLIRTQSFNNFSLDYYKSVDENYQMMTRIVNVAKKFATEFSGETYNNFLFMGNTGLGKTHLSTSIAKTVIDRGFDVCYVTAVGMLGDFEDKRFGHGETEDNTDRYYTADLLIIDDLGTEMINQFTLSCVYDVINSRINKRKCTIINTNLKPNEIEAKYNERIASRLLGEYRIMQFVGTDIRQLKRQ